MPPKTTTRGRGRGRGRGGTARGASAAASSSAAAGDSNEMDVDVVQEPEASGAASTTPATSEPANVARPGPAPVPVMTASESTADAAIPSSSTSIAPTTASTPAPTTSARGSAGSKFKPKGVRRSELERARLAEEQLKIQEQRNAEEARRLARLQRGQGRGRGRGRGAFMRGGSLRTTVAAGPLAAGISSGSGSRPGGGYAPASDSGSGHVKIEGEGKGISSIIVDSRIDADKLYNYVEVSDEEESASITSTKKKKSIMPMGIRRIEHKEEGVTMTTAAEIQAQETAGADETSSDDDLFVGGPAAEETEEPARDEGVWEVAQPRTIKKEEAGAAGTDQEPTAGIKVPDSPELKKKSPVSETKPKKKAAAPKDITAQILEEDLQHMLNLFTIQGDDDASAQDGNAHNAALEGHMFLFQFPAVLPPLYAVPPENTATAAVKPEPDDDVVMLNQPPVNIDLTQEPDSKGKGKAKAKVQDETANQEDGDDAEAGGKIKEGGFLGNLVVRKSGKVELSWGGQKLDLGLGIPVSFLRTAVLIEDDDVKPGDTTQKAGHAYGMGKIQGAFSLAPAWGEEEDWVVDPKELEIPTEEGAGQAA
ncbi:hypothetical protein VTJ49DRAFT_703 [Mycothermus thermophilus]|uniref:DNA-directed RNA polymerase III RPC4 n=1 Tax=Humicola insolens TaxID=85995 RepID=A0ABR3VF18_HUMIN